MVGERRTLGTSLPGAQFSSGSLKLLGPSVFTGDTEKMDDAPANRYELEITAQESSPSFSRRQLSEQLDGRFPASDITNSFKLLNQC